MLGDHLQFVRLNVDQLDFQGSARRPSFSLKCSLAQVKDTFEPRFEDEEKNLFLKDLSTLGKDPA